MDTHSEKRNFTIFAIEGAFFSIALVFISFESVLPVFLARLGAPPATISIIPVAIAIGSNVPGILIARRVEMLARKKPFVIAWGIGQRAPWVVVGLLTPLLAVSNPHLLVAVILACLLFVMVSQGLLTPAFYDLIGNTVPSDRRGILMAIRSGISYFIGIGSGFLVTVILRNVTYPWNYSMLYLIAAGFFTVNLLLFTRIDEPVQQVDPEATPAAGVLAQLADVLRGNRSYRGYIAARALLVIAHSTAAFFPIYLVRAFGLDDSASGTFVVIAAVTYVVVNPLLGRLGDRAGYRAVLIVDALVLLGAGFVGVAGVQSWLAFGIISGAAVGRTVNLLSINMAVDYAPEGRIPIYIAASGLIVGVIAPAGLAAGFLVEHLGYPALFWMLILCAAAALLVLLFVVSEPRGTGFSFRPIRRAFARITTGGAS